MVVSENKKEKDWDLSISKYREIEYEEVKHDSPKEILERIEKLENKILSGVKELKVKHEIPEPLNTLLLI